jgi:hypothetical protein
LTPDPRCSGCNPLAGFEEWTPALIMRLFSELAAIREILDTDKFERIRAIAEYTSADPTIAIEEIRMIVAE